MADRPMLFPDGGVYSVPESQVDQARSDFFAIPNPTRGKAKFLLPDASIVEAPVENTPKIVQDYGGRLITGREKFNLTFSDGGVYEVPVSQIGKAVGDFGARIEHLFRLPEPTLIAEDPKLAEAPFANGWVGTPESFEAASKLKGFEDYTQLQEKNSSDRRGFFEGLFDVGLETLPFFVGTGINAARLAKIQRTTKALEAGEQVAPEDLLDLNIFLAEREREANASWLGQAGSIIRQSVTFGTEILGTMALTGGIGTLPLIGKKAAEKGVKEALEARARTSVKNHVTKLITNRFGKEAADTTLGKLAVKGAGATAFVGTLGGVGTGISQATQLAATGISGEVPTTGQAAEKSIYNTILGEADPGYWSNLFSGATADFIERASEVTGKYMTTGLGKLFKRIPGVEETGRMFSKAIDDAVGKGAVAASRETAEELAKAQSRKGLALVGTMVGNFMRKYNTDIDTALDWLRKFGYDGIAEEMLEERLAGFAHGLMGTDGSDAGLRSALAGIIPNADQFKAELLAFSFPMLYVSGVEQISKMKIFGGGGMSDFRRAIIEGKKNERIAADVAETKDSASAEAASTYIEGVTEAALNGDLEGNWLTRWVTSILTLPFTMDIHRAQYGNLTRAFMANGLFFNPLLAKSAYENQLRRMNVTPGEETAEQKEEARKRATTFMTQHLNAWKRGVIQTTTADSVEKLKKLNEDKQLLREQYGMTEEMQAKSEAVMMSIDKAALANLSAEEKKALLVANVQLRSLGPDSYMEGVDAGATLAYSLEELEQISNGTMEDTELEAAVLTGLLGADYTNNESLKENYTDLKLTVAALRRGAADPKRWFTGDTVVSLNGRTKYKYHGEGVIDGTVIVTDVDTGLTNNKMRRSDLKPEKLGARSKIFIVPGLVMEATPDEMKKFVKKQLAKVNNEKLPQSERDRANIIPGGYRIEDIYDAKTDSIKEDSPYFNAKIQRKKDGPVSLFHIPGAISSGYGVITMSALPLGMPPTYRGRRSAFFGKHAVEDSGEDIRKSMDLEGYWLNRGIPSRELEIVTKIVDWLKGQGAAKKDSKLNGLYKYLVDKNGNIKNNAAFEFLGKLHDQRLLGYNLAEYGAFESVFLGEEISELPENLNEVYAGLTADLFEYFTEVFGAGYRDELYNPWSTAEPLDLSREEPTEEIGPDRPDGPQEPEGPAPSAEPPAQEEEVEAPVSEEEAAAAAEQAEREEQELAEAEEAEAAAEAKFEELFGPANEMLEAGEAHLVSVKIDEPAIKELINNMRAEIKRLRGEVEELKDTGELEQSEILFLENKLVELRALASELESFIAPEVEAEAAERILTPEEAEAETEAFLKEVAEKEPGRKPFLSEAVLFKDKEQAMFVLMGHREPTIENAKIRIGELEGKPREVSDAEAQEELDVVSAEADKLMAEKDANIERLIEKSVEPLVRALLDAGYVTTQATGLEVSGNTPETAGVQYYDPYSEDRKIQRLTLAEFEASGVPPRGAQAQAETAAPLPSAPSKAKPGEEALEDVTHRRALDQIGEVLIVDKPMARRPGGMDVAARRRKSDGRISVHLEGLRKKFEERAWEESKVEGVEPLPADAFIDEREWINWVFYHEALHAFPAAAKDKADIENEVNANAMRLVLEDREVRPDFDVLKELGIAQEQEGRPPEEKVRSVDDAATEAEELLSQMDFFKKPTESVRDLSQVSQPGTPGKYIQLVSGILSEPKKSQRPRIRRDVELYVDAAVRPEGPPKYDSVYDYTLRMLSVATQHPSTPRLADTVDETTMLHMVHGMQNLIQGTNTPLLGPGEEGSTTESARAVLMSAVLAATPVLAPTQAAQFAVNGRAEIRRDLNDPEWVASAKQGIRIIETYLKRATRIYDKDGKLTDISVGYGHNMLTDNKELFERVTGLDYDAVKAGEVEVSEAKAEQLLEYDFRLARSIAMGLRPDDFDSLPGQVKESLIDLAYWGVYPVKFKLSRDAVKAGRWSRAASELLDSKLYKDLRSTRTGPTLERLMRHVNVFRQYQILLDAIDEVTEEPTPLNDATPGIETEDFLPTVDELDKAYTNIPQTKLPYHATVAGAVLNVRATEYMIESDLEGFEEALRKADHMVVWHTESARGDMTPAQRSSSNESLVGRNENLKKLLAVNKDESFEDTLKRVKRIKAQDYSLRKHLETKSKSGASLIRYPDEFTANGYTYKAIDPKATKTKPRKYLVVRRDTGEVINPALTVLHQDQAKAQGQTGGTSIKLTDKEIADLGKKPRRKANIGNSARFFNLSFPDTHERVAAVLNLWLGAIPNPKSEEYQLAKRFAEAIITMPEALYRVFAVTLRDSGELMSKLQNSGTSLKAPIPQRHIDKLVADAVEAKRKAIEDTKMLGAGERAEQQGVEEIPQEVVRRIRDEAQTITKLGALGLRDKVNEEARKIVAARLGLAPEQHFLIEKVIAGMSILDLPRVSAKALRTEEGKEAFRNGINNLANEVENKLLSLMEDAKIVGDYATREALEDPGPHLERLVEALGTATTDDIAGAITGLQTAVALVADQVERSGTLTLYNTEVGVARQTDAGVPEAIIEALNTLATGASELGESGYEQALYFDLGVIDGVPSLGRAHVRVADRATLGAFNRSVLTLQSATARLLADGEITESAANHIYDRLAAIIMQAEARSEGVYSAHVFFSEVANTSDTFGEWPNATARAVGSLGLDPKRILKERGEYGARLLISNALKRGAGVLMAGVGGENMQAAMLAMQLLAPPPAPGRTPVPIEESEGRSRELRPGHELVEIDPSVAIDTALGKNSVLTAAPNRGPVKIARVPADRNTWTGLSDILGNLGTAALGAVARTYGDLGAPSDEISIGLPIDVGTASSLSTGHLLGVAAQSGVEGASAGDVVPFDSVAAIIFLLSTGRLRVSGLPNHEDSINSVGVVPLKNVVLEASNAAAIANIKPESTIPDLHTMLPPAAIYQLYVRGASAVELSGGVLSSKAEAKEWLDDLAKRTAATAVSKKIELASYGSSVSGRETYEEDAIEWKIKKLGLGDFVTTFGISADEAAWKLPWLEKLVKKGGVESIIKFEGFINPRNGRPVMTPLYRHLDEVTQDMLVDGANTSKARVIQAVNDAAQARYQAAMARKKKEKELVGKPFPVPVWDSELLPKFPNVTRLASEAEQMAAGEANKHCLSWCGLHGPKARTGNNPVYQVQDAAGDKSEMQIAIKIGPPVDPATGLVGSEVKVGIVQHLGFQNGSPSAEAKAVGGSLIAAIDEYIRAEGLRLVRDRQDLFSTPIQDAKGNEVSQPPATESMRRVTSAINVATSYGRTAKLADVLADPKTPKAHLTIFKEEIGPALQGSGLDMATVTVWEAFTHAMRESGNEAQIPKAPWEKSEDTPEPEAIDDEGDIFIDILAEAPGQNADETRKILRTVVDRLGDVRAGSFVGNTPREQQLIDKVRPHLEWLQNSLHLDETLDDVKRPVWAFLARHMLNKDRLHRDGVARARQEQVTSKALSPDEKVAAASRFVQSYAKQALRADIAAIRGQGNDRLDEEQNRELIRKMKARVLAASRYMYGDSTVSIGSLMNDDFLLSMDVSSEAQKDAAAELEFAIKNNESSFGRTERKLSGDQDEGEDSRTTDMKDGGIGGEEEKLAELLDDDIVHIMQRYIDMRRGIPGSANYIMADAMNQDPSLRPPNHDEVIAGERKEEDYFLYSEPQFSAFTNNILETDHESVALFKEGLSGLSYYQALHLMSRIGSIHLNGALSIRAIDEGGGEATFSAIEISENPILENTASRLILAARSNLISDPGKWVKRFQDRVLNNRRDIGKMINEQFRFFSVLFGMAEEKDVYGPDGTQSNSEYPANDSLLRTRSDQSPNQRLLQALDNNFVMFLQKPLTAPGVLSSGISKIEEAIDAGLRSLIFEKTDVTFRKRTGAETWSTSPIEDITTNLGKVPGFMGIVPGKGRTEVFSMTSPIISKLPKDHFLLKVVAGSGGAYGFRSVKGSEIGPKTRAAMMRELWALGERIRTGKEKFDRDEDITPKFGDFSLAKNVLAGGKEVFVSGNAPGARKRDPEASVLLSELGQRMGIFYPSGEKSSVYIIVGPRPKGAKTFEAAHEAKRKELDKIFVGKGYEAFKDAGDFTKRIGLYISGGKIPIVTKNGLPSRMRSVVIDIPNADGGAFFARPGSSAQAAESYGKAGMLLTHMKGHLVGAIDQDTGGIFKPMFKFIEHMQSNPLYQELMEYVADFNASLGSNEEPLYIIFDDGAQKLSPKESDDAVKLDLDTLRQRFNEREAGEYSGSIIKKEETLFVRTTDLRETTNVQSKKTPARLKVASQSVSGMVPFSEYYDEVADRYLDIAFRKIERMLGPGAAADMRALANSSDAFTRLMAEWGFDNRLLPFSLKYMPSAASMFRKALRPSGYGLKKAPEVLPEEEMSQEAADRFNGMPQVRKLNDRQYEAGDFAEILAGVYRHVVTDAVYNEAKQPRKLVRPARVRLTVNAPGFRYAIAMPMAALGIKSVAQLEALIRKRFDDRKKGKSFAALNKSQLGQALLKAQAEIREKFPTLDQINYEKELFYDMFELRINPETKEIELGRFKSEEIDMYGGNFVIPGSISFMTRTPRGGFDAHTLVRVMTPYFDAAHFISVHPAVAKRAGTDQDADARSVEFLQYNRKGELITDSLVDRAASTMATVSDDLLDEDATEATMLDIEEAATSNLRFVDWMTAFENQDKDVLNVTAEADHYDSLVPKNLQRTPRPSKEIGTVEAYVEGVQQDHDSDTIGPVAKMTTLIQTLIMAGLVHENALFDVIPAEEVGGEIRTTPNFGPLSVALKTLKPAVDLTKAAPGAPSVSTEPADAEERYAALRELFTNFLTQVADALKNQNTEPFGLTPDLAAMMLTLAVWSGQASDMNTANFIMEVANHPITKRYVELRKESFGDNELIRVKDERELDRYAESSTHEQMAALLEEEFVDEETSEKKQAANRELISLLFGLDSVQFQIYRVGRLFDTVIGVKAPYSIGSLTSRELDLKIVSEASGPSALTPLLSETGGLLHARAEAVIEKFKSTVVGKSYAPNSEMARAAMTLVPRLLAAKSNKNKDIVEALKLPASALHPISDAVYQDISNEIARIALVESVIRGGGAVTELASDANLLQAAEDLLVALKQISADLVLDPSKMSEEKFARLSAAKKFISVLSIDTRAKGSEMNTEHKLRVNLDRDMDVKKLLELQQGFVTEITPDGTWVSPLYELIQYYLREEKPEDRVAGRLLDSKKTQGGVRLFLPSVKVMEKGREVVVAKTLTQTDIPKLLLAANFAIYGPLTSTGMGAMSPVMITRDVGQFLVKAQAKVARAWDTGNYPLSLNSDAMAMAQRLVRVVKKQLPLGTRFTLVKSDETRTRADGVRYNPMVPAPVTYQGRTLKNDAKALGSTLNHLYTSFFSNGKDSTESARSVANYALYHRALQENLDAGDLQKGLDVETETWIDVWDPNDAHPIVHNVSKKHVAYINKMQDLYFDEFEALDAASSPQEYDAILHAMSRKSKTMPTKYRVDQRMMYNLVRGLIPIAEKKTRNDNVAPVGSTPLKAILAKAPIDPGPIEKAMVSAELGQEFHDTVINFTEPMDAQEVYEMTESMRGQGTVLSSVLSPLRVYPFPITGVNKIAQELQDVSMLMHGFGQESNAFAAMVHRYLGITRYGLIKVSDPDDPKAIRTLPFGNRGKLDKNEQQNIYDLLEITGAMRESEPINDLFKRLRDDIAALDNTPGMSQEVKARKKKGLIDHTTSKVAELIRKDEGKSGLELVTWGNKHTDTLGNEVSALESIKSAFNRLTSEKSTAVSKLRKAGRRIELELFAEIAYQDFELMSRIQAALPFLGKRDIYLTHRFGDGRLDGKAKEGKDALDDAISHVSRHVEGDYFLGQAEYDINFEDIRTNKTRAQQTLFSELLDRLVERKLKVPFFASTATPEESEANIRRYYIDKWDSANVFDANLILSQLIYDEQFEQAKVDPAKYKNPDNETLKWLKTYKLLKESTRGYKSREWTGRQFSRVRQGTYSKEFINSKGQFKPQTLNVLKLQDTYIKDVSAATLHRSVANTMLLTMDADGVPLIVASPGEIVNKVPLIMPEVLQANAFLLAQSKGETFDFKGDTKEQLEALLRKHVETDSNWKKHKSPFPSVASFHAQKGEAHRWLQHLTNVEMQFIFGGQDIWRWAMRITQWTKIQAVGWSIFFPLSLIESLIAGTGVMRNILRHPFQHSKEIRDIIRQLNKAEGGLYDFSNELGYVGFDLGHSGAATKQVGIVEEDTEYMRKKIEKAYGTRAATVFERFVRVLSGKGMSDVFFGSLFPAMKVWAAKRMADEAAAQLNPTEFKSFDDVLDKNLRANILRHIAPQINDAYGGQFWRRYPWANPKALQILNLTMFAPNWTLSAWNIAGGGVLTGQVLNNTMSLQNSDFVFKTNWPAMWLYALVGIPSILQFAIWGFAALSGNGDDDDKPLPIMNEEGRKTYIDITPFVRGLPWYTGDPTGKRRYYARFGKQAYEVTDGWLTEPVDQYMRKLSNPVKAIFEQVTGTSPGSDWQLEFSGMGFMGFFQSRDEELASSFLNSRFGYLAQKIMPMSFSTFARNPETAGFNFIAPTSKGMSQGKAVGALITVLNAFADAEEWQKYKGNPKARLNLEAMAPGILKAAELNGYDTAKIVNSAKAVVLGRLYKKFWTALNNQNTERLDAIARGALRVGGTLRGITTSMSNKASGYGRDLTDEERALIEEAFK